MSNEQLCITPIKSTYQKWKVASLDIETRSTDGKSQLLAPFCLAATCLDGTDDTVVFHDNIMSLMDYIITKGTEYRWVCHNGSGFDFRYFFNDECLAVCKHRGWRVDFIGSKPPKAFAFRKKFKKILVMDSAKLITTTLKNGCLSFGTQTLKGEIDFEGGEIFDPTDQKHREYLADDVKCLWQLFTKYRIIINEVFEVEPGCTAASTAFRSWRKTLEKPFYKHHRECSDFCRLSYYGGRTQVFFQGIVSGVFSFDVNSLYPYIMRQTGGLSIPVRSKIVGEKGFYHIIATVPKSIKYPPFPYRKPDQTGIIFPTGRFRTYAASIEIKQAIDMGCEVEVLDGWTFDGDEPDLFKDFVDKCERFRNMDYNGGIGMTCKIMQNSLYGFFGMRYEKEELVFGDECPIGEDDKAEWDLVYNAAGEMVPNLWSRNYDEDSINCIPAIAAWITACARVYLLQAILECEKAGAKVLMCDTDSIFCTTDPGDVLPIGSSYGEFKMENEAPNEMIILAPKSYAMIPEGKKPSLKCKGIPRKLLTLEDFIEAIKVEKAEDAIVKTFPQLNSLTTVLLTNKLGNENARRSLPIPGNIKSMVPKGINQWMENVVLDEG